MPNFRAMGSFSGEFNMENDPNLNWKSIPGFPKYAVTPDGQVWSYYTNRLLKPWLNDRGYLTVGLYNDLGRSQYLVHRLVGMAFIPLPPEFNGNYDIATIDHIDGNKLNNHYTNLEWVTPEENASRAWENGLCDDNKNPCFCVSIEDEEYTPFDSTSDMDRSLNLPIGTVWQAISKTNGVLQGKYIVGYTEDLDKKYLLPGPDAVGIIQLYSDAIANFTPSKKECFCVSIEDKKFTKRDSAREIDESLNLPIGTVSNAIRRANGILQGKYIVGYVEDLDQKYLSPKPDAAGIIQLYSDAIDNFTPHRKECFLIDSLDNSYTPFDSYAAIDRHLNLPIGTTAQAIDRANGLIRGRYIAGAIDDPRWKAVFANFTNSTIEQIVESYADQIERYRSRNIGPKKITNLQTGEPKVYNSLSEFAREKGIPPTSASRYLKNHSDLYRVELV